MENTAILGISPLRLPWATQDPFIFCSYHYDNYPGGNASLGPNASLSGRNIGQDFAGKDGWNMYHGSTVPGFPAHPHCGFETISIVTKGMVDHSDSLGASGRFGNGDVQWLTSGRGVLHAEMFPLLEEDSNPFEIFQIWMNLPRKSKKVDPYYQMFWSEDIPVIKEVDANGNKTTINLIAGSYNSQKALTPNPDSWAADENNQVQILTISMEAGATMTLPKTTEKVTRSLYFHEGDSISSQGQTIGKGHKIDLNPGMDFTLQNGNTSGSFLFLQGKPIDEPLVQHGPFVANSHAEIQSILHEYQRTQFGGWPYASAGPVHGKNKGRFSTQPDGTETLK